MSRVQPVQSCGQETLLPAADGRSCPSQPLPDRTVRSALGQHQDQSGSEDIARRQGTGLSDTAEFDLLLFGKHDGVADHISLDVNADSNVYSAACH
jgi:hypothetical protein